MKKRIIPILFLLVLPFITNGQDREWTTNQKEILAVIDTQKEAWNNYDLEGFMEGYWKSEELKFYGNSGVTYGWDNTLARYKRSYPDKEHTGTLNFVIKEISPIEKNSYYVLGEFHLKRDVGDADGIFMIILKKIKGEWKIVADTSC